MATEHPRRDFLAGVACACCATALGACSTGAETPAPLDLARPGRRTLLGRVTDVQRRVRAARGVLHLPEHQIYLVAWDPSPGAERQYADSAAGLLALAQKCPHLGCRIPWCESSEWFECPCHGTRLNRAGEYMFGPAPGGQTRYRLSLSAPRGDELFVDLATPVPGAPRGIDTIAQEPAGPFCVR